MRYCTLIVATLVAWLMSGCLKSEETGNSYVIKGMAQYTSGDLGEQLTSLTAYSFEADTTLWTIASYDDALEGIITSKEDPTQKIASPYGVAEPYAGTEVSDCFELRLPDAETMIVVVDPLNRLYAYTQQTMKPSVGRLYVTLIFKPWKETTAYKEGAWSFYNPYYAPLPKLETFVEASAQSVEGGDEQEVISNMKIYAFAADTTLWKVRSYEDAVGGIITSERDPSQTRTLPEYNAYQTDDPIRYRMTVDRSPIMIVAVDRTHGRYAYTEQRPDLAGESPTYSVVFRLWQNELWKQNENGWCVVNPDLEPEPEDTTPKSE